MHETIQVSACCHKFWELNAQLFELRVHQNNQQSQLEGCQKGHIPLFTDIIIIIPSIVIRISVLHNKETVSTESK